MPSTYGERVVLRVCWIKGRAIAACTVRYDTSDPKKFEQIIHKPHGIILVTGPTGSGKSTTLYAGLNAINSKDRNILTVEDPVEYELMV